MASLLALAASSDQALQRCVRGALVRMVQEAPELGDGDLLRYADVVRADHLDNLRHGWRRRPPEAQLQARRAAVLAYVRARGRTAPAR